MTVVDLVQPIIDTPSVKTDHDGQLEIVVSVADIVAGVQENEVSCAIALALRRTGHRKVWVLGDWGVWADGRHFNASSEFANWIADFDTFKNAVAPERFLLKASGMVARR